MSETPPASKAHTGATSKWRDLGVRSLAAAVMIPLALAVIWAGGTWFVAAITAIGLTMAYEWCRMVHDGRAVQRVLHAAAVVLVAAPVVGYLPWRLVPGVLVFVWGASIVAAWRADRLTRWGLVGIPYVALPVLALGLLRQGEWGLQAVLWIMVVVWAADIGAFFAGRIIGGPKLAPRISPKKTWAGLGGAVVAAMLFSVVMWWASGLANTAMALALGALMGIIEQMGDLFESAAKRRFGLKDSGNLIPGHGGILDRIDGLVAAAVAAGLIGAVHAGGGAVAEGLLKW